MDMLEYLKKTRELVRVGKYAEALERMVWFHDHADEHEPDFGGFRWLLLYTLNEWRNLGRKYPEAIVEMANVRDRKTRLMLEGEGTRELFQEVEGFNRALREEAKTVELFRHLDESQPDLARQCWSRCWSELFEQREFALIEKYLEDNPPTFMLFRGYIEHRILAKGSPYAGRPKKVLTNPRLDRRLEFMEFFQVKRDLEAGRRAERSRYVKMTIQLIEYYRWKKDFKTARQLRDRALEIGEDDSLRAILPDSESEE